MDIYTFYTLMLVSAALFPFTLLFVGIAGEFKPQIKGMALVAAVTWIFMGLYAFGWPDTFSELEKALLIVSTLGWALQKESREVLLGVVFLPFYMVTWIYLKTRNLLLIESQQDDIEALEEHWLSWIQ